MAARVIPIIVKVSGEKDVDKAVAQITNAFKKMENEAGSSAKGSSNAFSHYFSADFFAGLARQAFNAFLQQGKQFITDSVRLAQEVQNALKGIGSIGDFYGVPSGRVEQRIQELEAVKLGMLSVADATKATKPLLQFFKGDVDQAIEVVDLFSRSAAFGRQATLGYGESIVGASEGLKNMNPILMDNAGVTRNASLIMKDYGLELQDLDDKAKGGIAREKLILGLRKEVAGQMGDLVKATDTYTGVITTQDKAYQDLQRSIGQMIINNPAVIESNKIVTEQLNETTEAIVNQGAEAQRTARQTINAYALIKANFIPLVAFMKNLVVVVGEGLGIVVTASVGYIIKAIEDTINYIGNAMARIVNLGISGANKLGGAVGLPQIAPVTPPAAVDFGSKFLLDRMREAVKDLGQATRNLAEIEKERAENARRVRDSGFVGTGFGSSSLADRNLSPNRLKRAQQLADEALADRSEAAGKKTKEHLTELQRLDKSSERATFKLLYEMGQRSGFVSGTNQTAAAHNKGSLHPLGRALDFSVKGKSPAQIAQFIQELRGEGFTVFDERTRPKGQAVWGGPHIHAQFPAGGLGKDQFGPTDFAVRLLMSNLRGGPISAPSGVLNETQPQMRLTKDQEYLQQRKELLDLDKLAEQAALRRRNIEAEIQDDQRQGRIDLINLETDLIKFRKTAADDQITEQRRSLMVRSEELDTLQRIQQVQDEIATGPYNESLRVQLALLQDIAQIRRRDEEAIKDQNRSQLELADSEIFHSEQARAIVLRHLSESRSQTEIFADAIIDSYEAINDVVLQGVQKLTGGIRVVDNLIAGLITRLTNKLFQKLLDVLIPGGTGQGQALPLQFRGGGNVFAGNAGGSPASGGGIAGFIRNLFGGGGGGGSNAVTGGFAGGPGAGQYLGSGLLAGFLGGGVGVPPSLTSQAQSQSAITAAIQQAQGTLGSSATSAASGAFNLAGLGGSLVGMAPLIGAGLGSRLGGPSILGQILGGVGGGVFGMGAILSGGLMGLFTNPVTAIPGAALLLASYIIGKNAQRRRDETTRNQLSLDVVGQLNALLGQAKNMDLAQATAAFEQIRQNYFVEVNAMKDSKTRRIATDWWYKPEHPPQVTWKKIEAAVIAGQEAKQFSSAFIPTFASGGLVPYFGGMKTLIKVRPGERIDDVGMMRSWFVPGTDYGRDSVYTTATPGSAVRTRAQQRIPGFAGGSNAPAVSGTSGAFGAAAPIVIQQSFSIDAKGMVTQVLKSPDGRRIVVETMDSDVTNKGMEGHLGVVAVGLTKKP